ncbi:MAG: hypothetical protein ACOCT9_02325 [archaeon]
MTKKKRLERKLERTQNRAGDICVFLGMQMCKPSELEPYKCLSGDYMMCENYSRNYQKYIGGKND